LAGGETALLFAFFVKRVFSAPLAEFF
jgi:hypothetical protein